MFKGGWFSRAPSPTPHTNLTGRDTGSSISLSGLDEQADIILVMRAMDHVMDDNLEAAEAELETGASVWHKMGQGAIGFIRSAAGFEQAVMKEASETLAAAETAAYNAQRHAARSPRSNSSYPAGTEFALASAETQLMAAVIGVLSESIMEAMKAFYKMRTAFKTLEAVSRSIEEVKARRLAAAASGSSSVNSAAGSSLTVGTTAGSSVAGDERRGLLSVPGATANGKVEPEFKNAVDEYIESGGNLCYGTLLLFIGMIPPAMSRLLSILGFHGDRRKGVERLWESAEMMNSHGALAAIILLVYYQMLTFCDIVETDESKGGMPREKCEKLLYAYRDKYKNSPMWILEEARLYTQKKEVEKAIELLEFERKPQMKQIEAICVFEKALNLLCLHRYEQAAQSFVHLLDLNSWSDAMYCYIAGSCYVELYRESVNSDPSKAEEWSRKAEELFSKVATHLGKKKFMARALPLESFTDRKVKKWQRFARERRCRLVEAVGISPLEEMIYMWNGFTRMNEGLIAQSLKNLEWQPPAEEASQPKSCITEFDEKVVQSFLKGVLARHRGEYDSAKEIFEKEVLSVDKLKMKEENWVLPSTHYEMAVVIWNESGIKESKVINEYLTKCASWEAYELDNRLGLRASMGLDVLKHASGP